MMANPVRTTKVVVLRGEGNNKRVCLGKENQNAGEWKDSGHNEKWENKQDRQQHFSYFYSHGPINQRNHCINSWRTWTVSHFLVFTRFALDFPPLCWISLLFEECPTELDIPGGTRLTPCTWTPS